MTVDEDDGRCWCEYATKTFRLIEIILEPTLQTMTKERKYDLFYVKRHDNHERGMEVKRGDLLINLPVVDDRGE